MKFSSLVFATALFLWGAVAALFIGTPVVTTVVATSAPVLVTMWMLAWAWGPFRSTCGIEVQVVGEEGDVTTVLRGSEAVDYLKQMVLDPQPIQRAFSSGYITGVSDGENGVYEPVRKTADYMDSVRVDP